MISRALGVGENIRYPGEIGASVAGLPDLLQGHYFWGADRGFWRKPKLRSSSKRQSSPNSDPPQSKRGGGGPTEAEQALIAEVLRLVEGLRQSTLANVPAKYRQEVVEENARTDSSTGD